MTEFDPQLSASASSITVNRFHKFNLEGGLILRPPFQRNLVWNAEQKSYLIDSILRGLPVPEIYIQTRTSADGDEETIVVDGQQRISTCLEFLDDELRIAMEGDQLDARWRNRTFTELDKELQRRFRSYQLIVRMLPDLNDAVLREVFLRLNKTVEALEPQELRHAAYTGPFIKLVESAAQHPVLSEVGVFTARDYRRRRNDELLAEIAFAIVSNAYPNKKEGLDNLFLTYERHGPPGGVIKDLSRRFGRVFAQLEDVGAAIRRTRFRNKSDFYTLFVLLGKEAERLPLTEGDETLTDDLRSFSNLVNDLRREENEGRSTDGLVAQPHGAEAAKYLRAVERAASDRLNRLRREEALRSIIGPTLAQGTLAKLAPADEGWVEDSDVMDAESDIDDEDMKAEKMQAEQTLLES